MNRHSSEIAHRPVRRHLFDVAIEWSLAAYWLVLTWKSTIFFTWPWYTGMYAPLYPFLIGGMLKGLTGERRWPRAPMCAYYALITVAMLALLMNQAVMSMDVARRLVAYGFWAMALLNLLRPNALRALAVAQAVAGVSIAGWVAYTAMTSTTAYRGGIDINWNYVSFVISFGVIPTSIYLYDNLGSLWRPGALAAALALGIELYGLLLLASRGTMVALGTAVVLILVGGLRRYRLKLVLGVAVLVGLAWGASQLPGGSALSDRWFQDRVESLNFRTPIWQAVLDEYATGSAPQMLLGRGLDSGEPLVATTMSGLGTFHNGFLQILFEEGIVGLLAFLAMHAWCLLKLLWSRSEQRLYGLMVVAFITVANVSGSNEHLVEFWVAFGAAAAIASEPARMEARRARYLGRRPLVMGSKACPQP